MIVPHETEKVATNTGPPHRIEVGIRGDDEPGRHGELRPGELTEICCLATNRVGIVEREFVDPTDRC